MLHYRKAQAPTPSTSCLIDRRSGNTFARVGGAGAAQVGQPCASLRAVVYISAQGSGGYGNGLAELAFTGEVNSDVTPDGKIKPDAPEERLYNLENDPRQAVNVIRKYPEIADEMRKRLSNLKTGVKRETAAPGKP
jgi:hypothetical protein